MPEPRLPNRLLASLSPGCSGQIVAASTHVELPLGMLLSQRDQSPRYLYFLTSGLTSIVFNSERGSTVELSTLGAEGLIGWSYLLGPMLPSSDCDMQVGGAGYRIPVADMQEFFDNSAEVRSRVLEYAQHQIIVSNQLVACNRLHPARARFARWLLMVSDRIGSNELTMTQEFMSDMLGTRRTTVAEVCAELGRSAAIEGRRGEVRIVDRAALEKSACECYPILRARFGPLYSLPYKPAAAFTPAVV